MPKKQKAVATLTITPNPADGSNLYQVTGAGFTVPVVNVGAYGECDWVTDRNLLAVNVPVVDGAIFAAFSGHDWESGEVYIEAREPGSGQTTPGGVTVPPMLARVTLVVP